MLDRNHPNVRHSRAFVRYQASFQGELLERKKTWRLVAGTVYGEAAPTTTLVTGWATLVDDRSVPV
jgi:hypothetical protein